MAKAKHRLVTYDPKRDGDTAAMQRLHMALFPDLVMPYFGDGRWWLVYAGSKPIAFAGYSRSTIELGAAYLWRVGVLEGHRGHGLQRTLMDTCVVFARLDGFDRIVSDTTENPPSANNFVRTGWSTYVPAKPWSLPSAIYWIKTL